jgi:predicted  nucleic acid-binding Zn-ribbon protein
MNTTQVAGVLFRLQQLDLELDRLHAEEQGIISSMQGNAKLRRTRQDYEAAQQQWQASVQTQKDAEWTLEDLTQRLQQREQRLFEGGGNSPRGLKSLQEEVQRLRAQQGRQEEQVLHAIDVADSLQEVADQKRALLQQVEDAWQKEIAGLVARRDQLQAQQQTVQGQRQTLADSLTEAALKRYEALRRTRQGRAVAKIEHNSCQWCRVILTPSELQHVRAGLELQTCTNCGRILYYDR